MKILKSLLRMRPGVDELRAKLLEVERQRKRRLLELRRCDARRAQQVERIRAARAAGNDLEVDYLWEDLKLQRHEAQAVRKEVRVLNLECIGLRKYIRGLERLAERGKADAVAQLMRRIAASGLEARLAAREIAEVDYLHQLESLLEEAGVELDMLSAVDPDKEEFLAEVDAINELAAGGEREAAAARENQLGERLAADEVRPW